MNIAIIGYGSMGQEIEREATLRSHRITHRINSAKELARADLGQVDVAIEFTRADQASDNVSRLLDAGRRVVCGTTGWYDHLPAIAEKVRIREGGFLYSPNFSIGVQLFLRVVKAAARLVERVPEYDVYGHEHHHGHKADSPSGTALRTAEILLENIGRKSMLVTETLHRPPDSWELHFTSSRGGHAPGRHCVTFDSPADTIEIVHTARTRAGFAQGAVVAAEWLHGRTGFFSMDRFVEEFLR
jgi:4-hydroxy-tetrahydrodipicolinate reductase